MEQEPERTDEVMLSIADIRRAASEGAISEADAGRLIGWACSKPLDQARKAVATEQSQGFNVITIAYYFGAILMILAAAWFLTNTWETLGTAGVLVTTLIYFTIAAGVGWWIRSRGFFIGGGLLITVAVTLVPLMVLLIEDLSGLWLPLDPAAYDNLSPVTHSQWMIVEISAMVAAVAALLFSRFGFLMAPLVISFLLFAFDFVPLILGRDSLDSNTNAWISVGVGFITILIGFGLDKVANTGDKPRSQDFAFWCYLFGLMSFWGGFTSMQSDSEIKQALYLLLNLCLIAVALLLRRTVFLVFGAVGVHIYLGHLAYVVFRDSVLFPFALALIGLSLIMVTVLAQWYLRRMSKAAQAAKS